MIRLRVLGSLALWRDDGTEIVSVLAQPKRVALLAYFAASPSAYHRRDALLAMFWPERDDARGREALNTAISFLRRELGRNAIVSRGLDEISLNAEICWSDVGAFRAAVDGRSFAEALALYRGNLLDGFHADNAAPFEDWLERTRAQLRSDAARAARATAEERERSQHHTTAISCARRALELSDDDERVLRQLLELLERLGDRAGALVAYEAFERRLAEEFSAEPSIETRALIGRIRAKQGESHASSGASSAKSTPWVIEREIGRGGMATVYLARDTAHDRPVALKMMRPELMSSGAERFLREIRITARLAHPRILPLIDSGVREGAPYLVTPYIEGESLRDRLRRVGAISTREALDFATQIAEALDYAHRSGVIHCDIKPENILLADGQVVVADFGVARAVGADASLREVVGSHGYMSPEQRDPNGALDARSDLYSLGCVVTEAICGAVPRDALHADEMLENHDAWERLRRLVDDCLARDKERRPPSATLLLDRLRVVTREMDAELTRPTPTTHAQTGRRATRWKTIRRFAVAGGALGIAVLATLWPSRRSPSASAPPTRLQVTHSGTASNPALSPDGQTIAFVEGEICRNATFFCTNSLVVQDLVRGQTALLARGTQILHPKWNPAGGAVLFMAVRVVGAADTTRGTYLVSSLGGPSQRVGPGGAAAFSNRGDTIVLATATNGATRLRFLRTADLDVLDSATVPSIHGPWPFRNQTVLDLDWSPDGRWLALLVYRGQSERRLFLVSRRGGMVTDSITVPARMFVRWVHGGEAVLLLLQNGPLDDKVFKRGVDRRTGHFTSDTATILEVPEGGPTLDVSRDGTTIAFAGAQIFPTELTAIERVGGRVTSRILRSFTGWNGSPTLSPDGRTIAWAHSDPQGATANVYLIPFDSGAERRLTTGKFFGGAQWLRDQRLVTMQVLGGPGQYFVVNLSDAEPRPFGPAGTSGNPWRLQWLGDSLYLLEHTTPRHLLVLDSAGSTRDSLVVPDTLGQLLTANPDGRQIWFSRNNVAGRRVYSLDRRTKQVKVAFDAPSNSFPVGWANDVYYVVTFPKDTAPALSRVNPNGTLTQIAIIPKGCDFVTSDLSLSMSRDGTRFVCVKRYAVKRDIFLQRGFDLGR